MQELKELKWTESKQTINQIVNSWKREVPLGLGKKEFIEIRNNLLQKLEEDLKISLQDKKIYATGHQPDIHHPGILTKDIVLYHLLDGNSVGLHFIVDTDYFEFEYFYPIKNNRNAELMQFSAHSHSTFEGERVEDCKRSELISILKSQKEEVSYFVNRKVLERSQMYLQYYIEKIQNNKLLHNVNEEVQSDFLNSQGFQIYKLSVSKLIKTEAFLLFVELIRRRQKEFVEIHNQALEKYRKEHKIKNHAQPLPNLGENEMPFWDYRNHERVCFSVNEMPIYALPRAVTLTLFLRIFLCDFFIHGIGGARYEQICEQIAKNFFQVEACPYRIATATMHLAPNVNFELPRYEEKELLKKIRELEYSPEHFLDSEHPLAKEKKRLLNEFKNPNTNKKDLHTQITSLNKQMRLELSFIERDLQNELSLLGVKNKTKQVFETRTFPFFYYNLEELIKEIRRVTLG